jgi:glycosyltransferase involved in cell wall biosynthesis
VSERPVLLVTSEVPHDRVAAFRALHAHTPLVVARFGGERRHAGARAEDPGVPVLDVSEAAVARLVLRRRWRAVVAGTVGRVALPAAYAAARVRDVPFVLWSALWAQPRTPAHLAAWPLMRHLYRRADAVAAYGEHVAAYAAQHGARRVRVAPQAVDPAFWSVRTAEPEPGFHALFVGRPDPEKGLEVLLEAWRRTGLKPPAASLTVVGTGPVGHRAVRFHRPGHHLRRPASHRRCPQLPRARERSCRALHRERPAFREPWGLVVNEAMHQHIPVITTDAVGAAAGGLARHERNALVVAQRDPAALAAALTRMAGDRALRERLGANAGRDVAAFTPEAWAAGMAAAIHDAEETHP